MANFRPRKSLILTTLQREVPSPLHLTQMAILLPFKMYTKITEVNLTAFAYRLFHEDFSSILLAKCSGISTILILYIHLFGRDSMYIALVTSYLILVEL